MKHSFSPNTPDSKPHLFEEIIKKHIDPQNNQTPDSSSTGNTPLNFELNPLNITLVVLGAVGISYGIYKIHSLITKYWKNESQQKTIAPK